MRSIISFLSILPIVLAVPAPEKRAAAPTVEIASPQATIVGSYLASIDTFNGVPFAQPPVGALRLKPPQPLNVPLGTVKAVGIPKACPQLYFSNNPADFPASVLGVLMDTPLFQAVSNAGEDCLTLNIIRPAGLVASAKVPVLFWIYGGGFVLGSTQQYDGRSLVAESVANGKPIIFVAVNYRVGGFGFMPGKEILEDGSANLGLHDQRQGLKWVADNIAAFGGDPEKVTIWGESAGAISVLDQMVMYDGDNKYNGKSLFRGAIMNSGSVIPADPVDCPKGQAVYDAVVAEAGCSSSNSTLECLRELPYISLLKAVNSLPGVLSYNSVALSYLPRPDGSVLTVSPDILVRQGKWAKVPFIIGDQEDEGTLFALFQPNITTKPKLVQYLSDLFFHNATTAQLNGLVDTYQDISIDGSPFRTLFFNNWYPQFKRLAAILGDLVFTLSRRVFLDLTSTEVPTWSYLSSYGYGIPIMGSFHGGDILQVFYGILPNYASRSIRDYYFNFVHSLDPNKGSKYMNWPEWKEKKQLMNFHAVGAKLITDDFRSDSYEYIKGNMDHLYF